MENKFKEGQRVRILPKAQLAELKQTGADISEEMLDYGNKEAIILETISNHYTGLLVCILDIDENEWLWYENLLEPLE